MKATAHIKQHQIIDAQTALVDAVITSNSHDCIDSESAAIALQAATGHNMVAVAGSGQVLEHTPYRTVIRGMMAVASEAIPFQAGMDGFTSISSNVYMDDKEKIWSLRENEAGKVLVKSHVIDDQEEISALLSQCSNVDAATYNTRDREFFQAVSSAETAGYANAADVVEFAHMGQLGFGVVVASHIDENQMPVDGMTVLPFGSESAVSLSSANILANHGDLVKSDANPEGYEEPSNEFVSASSTADDMVAYWKQVYGQYPEFWKKFEARIRSYKFFK